MTRPDVVGLRVDASRGATYSGYPPRTVAINAACTACGMCIVTCPEHALRPAPGRPLVIDERCTTCLACIEICPVDAIIEVAA
jgi:ferredoxin